MTAKIAHLNSNHLTIFERKIQSCFLKIVKLVVFEENESAPILLDRCRNLYLKRINKPRYLGI